MAGKTKRMGDCLVESGLISRDILEDTLQKYEEGRQANPHMKHLRVGELLVSKGLISENVFLAFLAKQFNPELMYIPNLGQVKIDDDSVKLIPHDAAEELSVIAVYWEDEGVVVAISDPFDIHAQERVREYIYDNVIFALASEREIRTAIRHHYADLDAKEAAEKASGAAKGMFGGDEISEMFIADSSDEDDSPVVSFLRKLLEYGYSRKASDVHIEPFRDETVVRIRINGMLSHYTSLNERVHRALIARIKVLANLDISERRLPQDGHFDYSEKDGGALISVRVSVCPCIFGEKAVIRYLNINTKMVNDETFGMNRVNYEKVLRMLHTPHGIVYVTGATGSGKTTTLYKMLDYLSSREISIASIEDPVERNVDRVSQMQVNVAAGLTFETGLRAILRQDPDVFMVGETRDKETASISVRAAITGHLVLSSLHTNDSVSSITRLVDMEIPRYMLSASLIGIIAQRLVRVVCDQCAADFSLTEYEQDLSFLRSRVTHIRKGKGCPACNGTGYKGRQSVHEVMVIDNKIRRMINDASVDSEDIKNYCCQTMGMVTLESEIINLIEKGITTPEEFLRVTSTIGIE